MASRKRGARIVDGAPEHDEHIKRNQLIEIDSVHEHPENYNKHPDQQLQQLAQSLETFGQIGAIVVKAGRIYAGNGLWMAAKRLGWETIRADILADDYPEALARAYLVADNELGRNSKPDEAQLLALLEEAREAADQTLASLGYTLDGLEELKQKLKEREPQEDVPDVPPRWAEAQRLQRKWKTAEGQIWQLGEHRLGIGDALERPFVLAVQDGRPADQILTDPPYGVDYGAKSIGLQRIRKGPAWQQIDGDQQEAQGDYRAWFARFLSTPELADYNTVYCFIAGQTLHELRAAWDDAGLTWGDYLVWVKHAPVLTRKDYHAQHEFVVFGWRNHHRRRVEPGTSTIMDDGLKPADLDEMGEEELRATLRAIYESSNVIRHKRPSKHERHPTEKPLGLITRLVEQGSPAGGAVIDQFMGSGTTILAAQRAHRTAYGTEKRPEYAAVILERWLEATGTTPEQAPPAPETAPDEPEPEPEPSTA